MDIRINSIGTGLYQNSLKLAGLAGNSEEKAAKGNGSVGSGQQTVNAAAAVSAYDSIEISAEAYALQSATESPSADVAPSAEQQDGVKADTKGIYIERKASDTNRMTIRFENTAYVYRAIEKGVIEIDGKELILTEDLKEKLTRAAEEANKNAEAAMEQSVLLHNMEAAKQSAEAVEEAFGDLVKMLEIARRIAKGGHVPALDEKKLMEFSFEMYLAAKTAALTAKEQEEHDSLFEEEEESGSAGEQQADPLTQVGEHSVEMDVSVGESVTVDSVSAVVVE